MDKLLIFIRNFVISAILAWLGLEFAPDQKREPERPAPADQPADNALKDR